MGASGVSGFECLFQYDIEGSKSRRNQRGSIADGGQGDEVSNR